MSKLNDKALRGVAAISDMLGADLAHSLRDFAATDRFGSRLSELALEFCYADNWTEDGLSRREKSLLLIAALVALRQPDELRNHLRLGVANGIVPAELEKILVHLVPYVGFPATSVASKVMREFLKNPAAQVGGSGSIDLPDASSQPKK